MDYTQWVKWGAVISTARGVEGRGEQGEKRRRRRRRRGGGDAFISTRESCCRVGILIVCRLFDILTRKFK